MKQLTGTDRRTELTFLTFSLTSTLWISRPTPIIAKKSTFWIVDFLISYADPPTFPLFMLWECHKAPYLPLGESVRKSCSLSELGTALPQLVSEYFLFRSIASLLNIKSPRDCFELQIEIFVFHKQFYYLCCLTGNKNNMK